MQLSTFKRFSEIFLIILGNLNDTAPVQHHSKLLVNKTRSNVHKSTTFETLTDEFASVTLALFTNFSQEVERSDKQE